MAAAWPTGVNQNYILGSYQEQPDRNVAEFTPEVGPPKVRRRMSISTDQVNFDQVCTRAEWVLLRTFYRTTLKDGTQSFMRLRPRTGVSEEFMFTAAPEAHEMTRDRYQVSIRLRSMP